ncbi:P63C domain-containing protein [Lentibacillus sp. CBA3610]|uniref:P63C domain-containing protein n=1 Tax=Lentibacillus sp. CBA3610 TaxID=2518176 RepID=UPI001595E268|nr:P63C domain-containing protein [Lentibacillus sp. CBA3610]QKY70200.1 hypothetical protein Len3610_11895 [Lentibacillus sp. CBA3610]
MDAQRAEVIASGVLEVFNELPCYVLDNGQRIFRFSNLTKALRGKEHGKFGNYLAASNIQKYLPERLTPLNDKNNDRVPQGAVEFMLNGKVEKGYNSEDFMDVCTAFIEANNKEDLSNAQKDIVINAQQYILACAKVGITALIDEATGYQNLREENALQLKLKFFLADQLRDWEKTFPDELWRQFGRLTNWEGNIHSRPRYWGKLVNEFIYDCIDEDLAKYLRDNKPMMPSHVKYHQWLNENHGVRALTEHIWQIIGMARSCNTIYELRELVDKEFKGKSGIQLTLF